ncbi:natural cytotoxicity triggering receptor 3-like [Bombina bombina]|uniref:natural cytotoxicity triggering receptor 3-like n=1 Tax=Bombina bombina TaxID=8345 RepID=UPI00235AB3B9|nr:natural cytotoxicity triggering receptor 3-like [Bombina bombina]
MTNVTSLSPLCNKMTDLYLLFILAASQGSHPQTVYVSQIPAVNSPAGSSVTLRCSYTLSEEATSPGWYKWYRHVTGGPEVSDNNPDYKGRTERPSQSDFSSKRSADIVLHRVNLTDTGMYICYVAFNYEKLSGYGNGTFLTVTAAVTEKSSRARIICVKVGAAVFIISILVLVYCCYIRQAERNLVK